VKRPKPSPRKQFIACVGARSTPPEILRWMEKMGAELVRRGFSIISGNASGADQAWVRGGNDVDPAKVKLCLPWRSFEAQAIHPGNVVAVLDELQSSEKVSYFHLAAKYHPAWDQLMLGARKLHARNAMIVEPAQELVGYVDHSRPGGGGAGMAFRLADGHFGIRSWDVSK